MSGGVGKIGHIMFWESTYGVRLGKKLSEKVLWIRGAPLTYGTIDQNETTSSASAPVPAFANTIGLGLFVTDIPRSPVNRILNFIPRVVHVPFANRLRHVNG